MNDTTHSTPLTASEYNALDPYSKNVWDETYRERFAHYTATTLYSHSTRGDMAARDADRAARTYAATGERIEFTEPALSPALAEAADLISSAYRANGRQTLSCDCGAEEVYIDGNAVGFEPDFERVARMIKHARYAHAGPHSIVAVLPAHLVLEVSR